jgi:imidazolonepropionase-like amidohydrolase
MSRDRRFPGFDSFGALGAPALALVALGASGQLAAAQPRGSDAHWLIRCRELHTAAGESAEGAFVSVSGGKIRVVSRAELPIGSATQTLEAVAVTPGLVDLSVHIDVGPQAVEQSEEATPGVRASDALDLFSERWRRELEGGVTTALASAPDQNCIGGLAVALKTAGPPTLEARQVKADAALRGAMGSEPYARNSPMFFGPPQDFYNRRPTTRMGVEWVWRDACYEALAAERDPARAFPGCEELRAALAGRTPLMIQAWTTQDIRTALFLKDEFSIPRLILDAAAEAWKEPAMVVDSGAAVVFPPFSFDGRTEDNAFFAWHGPKLLADRGVLVALSGHGAEEIGTRLAHQAGFAMRGGLSRRQALEAVTINPARMIGIDDRVGSIEAGKDADLVFWSGPPFELSSRVVGVMLDGELVIDPRPAAE